MGKIREIKNRLHQKRHGLASPRRLVLQALQVSRWTIQKLVLLRDNHTSVSLEMQSHTHTQRLHQKRHRLASPRWLVLLHACKWVGKSYKKLYSTEIITQACLLRCKITHKQITIIIDTSEDGYNATISSWWDMQNHTHRSILLAGRRSCCTWSSNKLHFCWRLRGLDSWHD
jgi:hypothetical protein